MKLFLSSLGIPPAFEPRLLELIKKSPNQIKIGYIGTAAKPYPPAERSFMNASQGVFKRWGALVTNLNLEDYAGRTEALRADLAQYDLIWLSGGNCYYLRSWMRQSGFDQLLPEILPDGPVVAGESAASIVLGPTLRYSHTPDEPENGPELIEEGLGIVPFVIIPHVKTPLEPKDAATAAALREEGFAVKTMTDEDAVIVLVTAEEEKYLATIPESATVTVWPYDPKIESTAQDLIKQIKAADPTTEVVFMGASALKIAGQNDIDLYVFSPAADFPTHLNPLTKLLGEPTEAKPDSIKWELLRDNFAVTVYLTDPDTEGMRRQLKVFDILQKDAELRHEYEALKIAAAQRSLREYQRRKYEFYNRILT